MTARSGGAAEIIRRCHAGLDASTLLEELMRRLPSVVPFDTGLLATTDPATLLYTGAVLTEQSHVSQLPGFLANEYLDDDVMKYANLAGGPRRADWLHRSTAGRPDSSPRYRDLLAPLGLGDELRTAFVSGGACWGVGCVAREAGSVPFTEHDAHAMTRLGPHIAEGIRTSLLLAEACLLDADPAGPGMLVLAEDLSVVATTPVAEQWLAEITSDHEPRLGGLPASVVNVVAALRSLDTSVPSPQQQARVRVRSRNGRWLILHASYLTAGDHERSVAVLLEPARRADLASLLLQAHGLSAKESEVTRLLLLGSSTRDISAALFISENTVQDHFKSIFTKVGVSSRRELVVRMLSDHYPAFNT